MDKVIVYTRPDGGMTMVCPAPDVSIDDVMAKDVPASAINPTIINRADVPADRTFRDAWVHENGAIDHDIKKCREIVKDKLRASRQPELAALDIASVRSLETGDTKAQAEILAQKQQLRDVTDHPSIEAATTVAELKAIIEQPIAVLSSQL